MNLTETGPTDVTAATAGGDDAHREPITDVTAWLTGLDSGVLPALSALGELLIGVAEHDRATRPEDAETFTARCLGVDSCGQLLNEERDLNPVTRLTFALALAEWIEEHTPCCQIGPAEYASPPRWTQTQIGGQHYRHPLCLQVHFPAGTLLEHVGCVIGLDARESVMHAPEVSAYVTPDHQGGARAVLERLADRANLLNPYRGRAVRATLDHGLQLCVIDLPSTATREDIIVNDQVWAEIDLGVRAVRDLHDLLNTHRLVS